MNTVEVNLEVDVAVAVGYATMQTRRFGAGRW